MTQVQFIETFKILHNWNYEEETHERNKTEVKVYLASGQMLTFDGHSFEDYNWEDYREPSLDGDLETYTCPYEDDDDALIGCNHNNTITFIKLSEVAAISITILD